MEIEQDIKQEIEPKKSIPTKKVEEPLQEKETIQIEEYNLSHQVETADSFMDDIQSDSLIWNTFKNDIPELMQLSTEFTDDIDQIDLDGMLSCETRDSIVQTIHGYILIFSTLDQMLRMTEALDLLADFLDQLDIDSLTSQQQKKLKILEFINNDITRFLQTVFVYKDDVDIYYLEDSLESSIMQLKNDVLGVEEDEDEELELF